MDLEPETVPSPSLTVFPHQLTLSPVLEIELLKKQNHPVGFLSPRSDYVAEIQNRFRSQPEIYTKFIGIMYNFVSNNRKKQKQSVNTTLKEKEVGKIYFQMMKLFENHEDLLSEFSSFLAANVDVNNKVFGDIRRVIDPEYRKLIKALPVPEDADSNLPTWSDKPSVNLTLTSSVVPATTSTSSIKKNLRSSTKGSCVLGTEMGYEFFYFFDKVRNSVSTKMYDDFLRCLYLFNNGLLSRKELIKLSASTFSNKPRLFAEFNNFLEEKTIDEDIPMKSKSQGRSKTELPIQDIPILVIDISDEEEEEEEMAGTVLEINYESCDVLGQSYLALPDGLAPPKCSGRTALCDEVLNDVLISFPNQSQWSSKELLATMTKKDVKKSLEDIEDERYEMDMVIETNNVSIKLLENIVKKMKTMPLGNLEKFQFDVFSEENSPIRKSIYRIYGDHISRTPELIFDSLKLVPHVAVPRILMRLKSKDEDWRDAQKRFNKIWEEEVFRLVLKSKNF